MVLLAGIGEAVGRLIKGNSYLIVLAALILIALALAYAGRIYMATGTETFVSKDSQIYRDIDYYNKNFQSTTFLILVTSDDVLDPAVLKALEDMDEQIRCNPKVANVTGLHTFVRQASKLAYGNEEIPDNRADIVRLLSSAPEGAAFIVPNERHAIVTVELQGNVDEKDEPSILEDVKRAIEWSPLPPGTSAVVTGKTAMMLEVQQEMMRSMMAMLATAIALMVIALWLAFGHASWRLLPLPIVLAGIIYTGGMMGLAGVPLTMVSMAVFPILIGLGVEYAIQFHNRMMEELGSGKAPGDAVVSTVKNIGPPVFYSMLTTSLGFLSILQSPLPMIHDFGLMCMIGIIVCFLTALFLLTSTLFILARLGAIKASAAAPGRIEKAIGRVAETTTRHPIVVVIAILAMLIGYSIDPLVGVEIDASSYAPQDLPSVVLFRTLTAIVGYKTDDLVVQVKAPDIASPETIRWIDWLSGYERRNNPDVLMVGSVATMLRQYNNDTLPDSKEAIAKAMDSVPPNMLKQYVDDFRTTSVVKMTVQDHPTDVKISGLERVQRDIEFYPPPPGISASLGGQSMMTEMIFGSLTSDRLTMTAWGGFCVLSCLLFVYRGNWVKAVVPVIAVTIVTGLSCVIMLLLHMKYTPLSVTLGSLTIGIGIDFSILHMERYYEEKARGLPPARAMEVATARIGNAIFASASTVIAGFGALAMSSFPILSNFGVVTIIDFLLALMSAFVIMPPLLVALDTWQSGRKAKSEVSA
ncbi:hydrophobe/amphiphile efflux-3 (HAE3) family transporter [Methanocella conradii]|uniref:hydrophobe/amphiphile efflux-3 (HAE3) family transporter n=1 Tax=Methanocella conradii TaxID=1175444 RepID=UPI001ED9788E|nr:hydrophobe/amphiphile efflux-3 (HAE3) family transporter [Methanocella conradii]